jgi:hypothetical protein
MQAHAERQGRSAHALKALLVHLQTPMEVKRDVHGAPGVILVGGRHPKEDEQVVTHCGSESPPIRPHHAMGEVVQLLHRAVQDIEIKGRSTCHRADHGATQDRDQLSLGTEPLRGRRRHDGLRQRGSQGQGSHSSWKRRGDERLPAGRAKRRRQKAISSTVGTGLAQSHPTRRTKGGVLVVGVLAGGAWSDTW